VESTSNSSNEHDNISDLSRHFLKNDLPWTVIGTMMGFMSWRNPSMAAIVLAGQSWGVVVSPVYFQNFDGYANSTTNTDFTENNNDAYLVITESGADRAFRARMQSSTAASAAVTVTNSEGQDFTVSTIARLAEAGPTMNSTFFSLAGAGSLTAFGSTEYRLNVNAGTGAVTLTRNGATVTFTTTTGGALPHSLETVYNMTLSAVYSSPTQAVVNVSVTSGASTFTGSFNDNAALVGSNFGYRIARASGDGTISVFFDDFSLSTVPEPSTPLMLMISAAGAFTLRRRL
jgi:hypothetical protein